MHAGFDELLMEGWKEGRKYIAGAVPFLALSKSVREDHRFKFKLEFGCVRCTCTPHCHCSIYLLLHIVVLRYFAIART